MVLVGGGEPAQAHAFRVLSGWAGRVYVDREGLAHRALGLARMGVLGLFRPSLWTESMRARREGFRQGKVQGDPWSLGGTAVLAPGDRLLYAHRDAGPEDEAPLDDVLAALPSPGRP